MKRWICKRAELCFCAVGTALAACGGSQPPIGTLSVGSQAQSDTSPTIYSFGKLFSGGREPQAGLIAVNGILYGTTYAGGSTACVGGCGVVFMITAYGREKVLYRFRGGSDGANPSASLLAVNGLLYGTTEYGGGKANDGTVFAISTTGGEKVLHGFGYDGSKRDHKDGANPLASLIDVNGVLYGTTANGGAHGSGTVFSITTTGDEKLVQSFGGRQSIFCKNPVANVTDLGGALYGTTQYGGNDNYGCVFRMRMTGSDKHFYLFAYQGGMNPSAGLINVDGTLYGTMTNGGDYQSGIAFSMTIQGVLTVLYAFSPTNSVGISPDAPLVDVNGILYGTTSSGLGFGIKGALFKLTPNGYLTLLHTFGYGFDGATPLAGVVFSRGRLYGTTSAGGAYGYGTVFAHTL